MRSHPFDPISFLFGLLFAAAGLTMLITDSGFELFEAKWVWPALLVVGGSILLVVTLRKDGLVVARRARDAGFDPPSVDSQDEAEAGPTPPD